MIQLVLCYGHSDFTRLCIESIYSHTPESEINLLVWENRSEDSLRPEDVNPRNTLLLSMDQNYGCSTALNALMKDFGASLDQDVMYISNDHVVFPFWIRPLLENRKNFHVISPMHPYGLPGVHGILTEFLDFKEGLKAQYLDHPESKAKIREYMQLAYGDDLERFVKDRIFPMPEVATTGQFWAGCFFLSRTILEKVGLFRTDRGLASDEDLLWVEENIRGKYSEGVYSHCYIHHFQSITGNRTHLSMDHAPGAFSGGPVPPLSEVAKATVHDGVERMKVILKRYKS